MAADRHLELCKILFSFRWRIIICTGLIWFNHANMILYHSAFGSLAGIILIGDQCVPGVYFFADILDLTSRWPPPPPLPNKQKQKRNFNTRNGFVALKILGLDVSLKSLYYIGQNLRIPQIQNVILAAILDLASRWPPSVILTPQTDSSP